MTKGQANANTVAKRTKATRPKAKKAGHVQADTGFPKRAASVRRSTGDKPDGRVRKSQPSGERRATEAVPTQPEAAGTPGAGSAGAEQAKPDVKVVYQEHPLNGQAAFVALLFGIVIGGATSLVLLT